MITSMAWCPVSKMVIIKKRSDQWPIMVSRKSQSFSGRSFYEFAQNTSADRDMNYIILEKILLKNIYYYYII